MTVKELIDELKKLPMDAIVVMSKDEEGNGFYECGGVTHDDNDCWDGESLGYKELAMELEEMGYTDSDICPDGKAAVIMWPL